MASAKAGAHKLHAEINFNPQEMIGRSGIKADVGIYRQNDFPSM
ncbi:MAG TPA: hypothetical protein VEC35_22530 [Noviherbaspirillum sp.]|nr:hypothetical protein [Noviherbaspirillum sp.]